MPDDQQGEPQINGAAADNQNKWTFDIQRGLAWSIILLFLVTIAIFAVRIAWSATVDDAVDIFKQMLGVLYNIVLLIVGYWFGSSRSSQAKDDTQNKLMDKLTPPAPTPPVDSGSTTTTTTIEKKD